MVMKPVITQARMSSAGESTRRAMSAETMKMPEPIMEPMTRVVALVRPRPFTSSWSWTVAAEGTVPAKGCRLSVWLLKSLPKAHNTRETLQRREGFCKCLAGCSSPKDPQELLRCLAGIVQQIRDDRDAIGAGVK